MKQLENVTAEEINKQIAAAEVIKQLPYGMELIRLPSGMELARLPKHLTELLSTVDDDPGNEGKRNARHRFRIDANTRRRKRRLTWDERGEVPPWIKNDNET